MMLKWTWAAALLALLGGAVAAVVQDAKDPDDELVGQYRDHFLKLEQARGAAPADLGRLQQHQCTRCHLGIMNPAYRVEESTRWVWAVDKNVLMNEKYILADPALDKTFRDRYPTVGPRVSMVRAFMAHPRMDLHVAPGSRHPLEKFDCLDCHGADDRMVELRTPPERERWTSQYVRYHPMVRSQPILLTKHVQSSCRTCHGAEAEVLDGAERYAMGARAVEAAACHSCHRFPDFPLLEPHLPKAKDGKPDRALLSRRPGPPFTHVADKLDKAWMYSFLLDPESFRPTTKMPRYFQRDGEDPAVAPQFGGQDGEIMAAAMTEYIFSLSSSRKYAPPPYAPPKEGDDDERYRREQRGEAIFHQAGCTACHRSDEIFGEGFVEGRYSRNLREFGPNAVGFGDKFDSPAGRTWLHHWLKSPVHYHGDTRMPDLRLKDDEIRDVVEYLLSLRLNPEMRKDFNHLRRSQEMTPVPDWKVQETPISIQDGQARVPDFYLAIVDRLCDRMMREAKVADPKTELAKLQPREKVLRLGELTVQYFGCYSCHEMRDPARKQDWTAMEPSGDPFTLALLPGTGKMFRMPVTVISLQESDAIDTYLLAHSAMKRPRKPREATERERKTWRGARILRSFNCGGCHELEAESLLVDGKPPAWCAADVKKSGGSVTAYGLADAATLKAPAGPLDVKKSLDRRPRQGADILPLLREYKKDAVRVGYDDSVLNGKMAPSLRLEGSRVRSEWLRDFLKSPTEIRPLLRTLQIRNRSKEPVEEFNLRMPTFPLKDHHLDDLVAYFKASGLQAADPAPPAPAGAKPAALATIKDACNKCHLADASSPVTDPDSAWAPVLKDSARRLRPAFVDAYLRDPLSFDAHSLMPAYNPKDPAEYKALVQALMSLK